MLGGFRRITQIFGTQAPESTKGMTHGIDESATNLGKSWLDSRATTGENAGVNRNHWHNQRIKGAQGLDDGPAGRD